MATTKHELMTTYGLDEATAYRVLAELASGVGMSTALLNVLHKPSDTPAYGGLFLPPEAYTADGRLYGLTVTVRK